MGLKDWNIGQKKMFEGAQRLQNFMESIDTSLRDLLVAFNENMKRFDAKLDKIDSRLQKLEPAAGKDGRVTEEDPGKD